MAPRNAPRVRLRASCSRRRPRGVRRTAPPTPPAAARPMRSNGSTKLTSSESVSRPSAMAVIVARPARRGQHDRSRVRAPAGNRSRRRAERAEVGSQHHARLAIRDRHDVVVFVAQQHCDAGGASAVGDDVGWRRDEEQSRRPELLNHVRSSARSSIEGDRAEIVSTPAVLDFTSTNLADSPRGIVSWSGTTVPSVDARRTVRSSFSRTPSPLRVQDRHEHRHRPHAIARDHLRCPAPSGRAAARMGRRQSAAPRRDATEAGSPREARAPPSAA